MDICIDFDGTCVTHEFPKVGDDIGAAPVLQDLFENGHNLILFTMRSGHALNDAINWFKQNGIDLYGVNKNPRQDSWTKSPKAFGNLYIDDAALGCPLIYGVHNRPYVDWEKVREMLNERELI